MLRAVRALAHRISTLTVASVVALSSLAAITPLLVTSNADAAANDLSWLTVEPASHVIEVGSGQAQSYVFAEVTGNNDVLTGKKGGTITAVAPAGALVSTQPDTGYGSNTTINVSSFSKLGGNLYFKTTSTGTFNIEVTARTTYKVFFFDVDLVERNAITLTSVDTVAPTFTLTDDGTPRAPIATGAVINPAKLGGKNVRFAKEATTDTLYLNDNPLFGHGYVGSPTGKIGAAFTSDGLYTFYTKDAAGNQSAPVTLTLDTTSPVINPSADADTTVGGVKTFNISQTEENPSKLYVEYMQYEWVAEKGEWQWLKKQGQEFVNTNNAALTVDTTQWDEGIHQVKVSSTDKAGNKGGYSFTFTVDNTAPTSSTDLPATLSGTVSITQTIVDQHPKSGKLRIWKLDEDGNQVNAQFFASTEVAVDANGKVVYELDTLADLYGDGDYIAKFTAWDLVGNAGVLEVPFTVDNTPAPVVPGGFGGGVTIDPIDRSVLPQLAEQVAAVNLLITGGNNANSRVFASSTVAPGTGGEVKADETNAVDGAVKEGEDQAKLIENSNSIFQYWWIVLLALLAIIAGIAISQRKIANKQQ